MDTHIHGFRNHDVMDNNFEGLNQISVGLLSCGVTSFLPTTLTSSIESLNNVVEMIGANYKKYRAQKLKGSFRRAVFTEKHKGAQNTKYFCDPSVDMLKGWQKLSNDSIKKLRLHLKEKEQRNSLNML